MESFRRSRKVLLAPMAGVTDMAMRSLCVEFGADLTYTEMVSAKGLSYANLKTRELLCLAEGETQVAVQLFGHEPDTMASQAAWIEDYLGDSLAYLDINMGCPARKIVTKGDGSALMCDPDLAAAIVSACVGAVQHPVTVKFRRGWSMGDETAPEFAKRMEAAGAAMLAVHGRYSQQMYNGSADWDAIKRVVDAVSVPVVGNGDITSGQRAVDMIEHTGCDAVMIARAAEGNPWIFSQARCALAGDATGAAEQPSPSQRIALARRHAEMLAAMEGRTIVRMRKHAAWYLKGLPGAAAARGAINACVTLDDFHSVFDQVEERALTWEEEHHGL